MSLFVGIALFGMFACTAIFAMASIVDRKPQWFGYEDSQTWQPREKK